MNLPGSVLENLTRVATTHGEVRAVYLFGSQVKGDARPDSDLDVGVLFKTLQLLAHTLALETELEQAAGRKVDLVDAGRAAAFLALEIVRGDLLPFERERQALWACLHDDISTTRSRMRSSTAFSRKK